MRRHKARWLIRSAWLPVVTAPLAMRHQLDARFLCVSNVGYPNCSVLPLCGFFRDCARVCLRVWHTLFAHLPLCSCVWECSRACMCACLCVCLLACVCVRACLRVCARACFFVYVPSICDHCRPLPSSYQSCKEISSHKPTTSGSLNRCCLALNFMLRFVPAIIAVP